MPDYPPALQSVIDAMGRQVEALSSRITAGNMTPDQWHREMIRLIDRYHAEALAAGAASEDITPEMRDLIERQILVQRDYLDSFAAEIEREGWLDRFAARALMYASAIATSFWTGDVVRQAGRMLPLPAMPAQGTQCLSRCGCSWEIDVLDAEAGNYDAYWRLGAREQHCQTCLERARQWSPAKIRGGILL